MTRQFSCAILSLVLCTLAHAFDIAVYFDARSPVNWLSQNPDSLFCWDAGTPRAEALANIGSANEQQAMDWLWEMGANYIIPYYPFEDDFTALLGRQLHGMKILNASYPGEAFKYLEAQKGTYPC